jgi:hypothetical protein
MVKMGSQGAAQGLTLRPTAWAATFGAKQPSRDEEVMFRHRDITLAGTLIAPAGAKVAAGYRDRNRLTSISNLVMVRDFG